MDTGYNQFDCGVKIGMTSGLPEIGTRLAYDTFQNSKYSVQCGKPTVGGYISVNGGMNPTGIYPVIADGIEFWTSKQALYHSYVWDPYSDEWKDRVVDSSIYLLKMADSGAVIDKIDLEPVIFKIIKNISSERVDTNERNVNATLWVNPWWYDKCLNFDSHLTTASPEYRDIPTSYSTNKLVFTGGDRNNANNYIRPASYCGVLGPVYAGTLALSDLTTQEPWKSMIGPCDPANIAVRDIKEDSEGNLWCLLQIGWHYADVYPNKVENINYMGYECRVAVQYDDSYPYGSSATPTSRSIYDPTHFSRQYQPPHSGTSAEQIDRMYRCGIPRARMFLVCFSKKTKFKTWDYLPFIPGTRGFRGKYYVDANTRGPCAYTISSPPLKLDVDSYGNVYACCGTWFGVDRYSSYPSPHWEGLSFSSPEYLYFYWRSDSEMPSGYTPASAGIDVGRIGPYQPSTYSYNTIWRYDIDTTAYRGKGSGGTYNVPMWKSPWTYTIGGDRVLLTAHEHPKATPTEKHFYLSCLGNRTLSKMQMKLDTTLPRPIPVYSGPNSNTTVQMPYNIRSWRSEWYGMSGSDSGRELAMEMDLLFAQCDLFTRNYYGTSGVGNVQPSLENMQEFDPQAWWEYEEPWRNANLMAPCQIHLDRTGFFQAGNATGDNPTGFNLAEAPLAWYPHMYSVGAAYYEEEFVGRSGCGTVYAVYNRVPLLKGCDGADAGWDVILRPASCPYANPADFNINPTSADPAQLSQYFERCSIMGCLPNMVSRIENESVVITPQYNFKYGMFTFSGVSWDSFQYLRTAYPQTKRAKIPARFHTSKSAIAVASGAELHAFGSRSEFIDSSVYAVGDYEPLKGESIIRYTQDYFSAVKTVKDAADAGNTAAQQAYAAFMQLLAAVKFYIYETLIQDINFGSFGSSLKNKDLCGMLTPMPLLHAVQYQDESTWHLDLVWDMSWGKRLYLVTPQLKKFDETWVQVKTDTKTYWEKKTTNSAQLNPMVTKIEWRDLSNDQIQKIKKWIMNEDYLEYCVEKWQQLEFVNAFPGGTRKSPQYNIF